MSVTAVLAEASRIAFADPGRMYWSAEEVAALQGTPAGELLKPVAGQLKPVNLLDRDTRAAVSEVEAQLDLLKGAPIAETKKIKLWNKPQALRTLIEHLGMLKDDSSVVSVLNININL